MALRAEIEERIIDFLEIDHIRHAPVSALSYGLRKRVELARALAMRPKVLMLDEPVAGMNREETEDMARFILDARAEWGVTVLMVEHDMGMVMDLSDHVVVLNFGQVIADGAPAQQADPEVIKAYLGAGDVGDCAAACGRRPDGRAVLSGGDAGRAGQRRPVRAGGAGLRDRLQGDPRGQHRHRRVPDDGRLRVLCLAAGMDWPVWLAIAGAVAASGLLGAVVERLTIRPMLGESPISVFMVTVGLASILVGVVELVWTADQRRLPEFMPRSPVMVGEAFVAPKVFYGFVAAALILVVLAIFRYWRGGVALRATAADQGAAYAMGINVPRVFSLAWVAAGAIAAVSGVIVGAIGGISSSMGVFGLSVLVVVIVGGLDSVVGALAGAVHRRAGSLGRRLPGRRIQAAGHFPGAGGGADGPALRPVRHP